MLQLNLTGAEQALVQNTQCQQLAVLSGDAQVGSFVSAVQLECRKMRRETNSTFVLPHKMTTHLIISLATFPTSQLAP